MPLPTEAKPEGRKCYLNKTVLQAAEERIAWAFDAFRRVTVSVSGGKDSDTMFELVYREAQRRGREINLFFLDQEAEYQATIDVIRRQMARPGVVPYWYQCPIYMTNATSYEEAALFAWEDGAEWVREKESDSIHENPSGVDRFYPFMEWFESQWGPDTCCFIGIRAEESLNRFGAVTRHPALPGINWSSPGKGGTIKLYPLYDWAFEDIWTFLGKEKIQYNKVYDWMWVKGMTINQMRVSNLIHEKAFRSLTTLQEFEPETYNRLSKRLKGVHTAALYGRESTVYNAKKLPEAFKTWRAYRDFLLETYPVDATAFLSRFADQIEGESVFRQQVKQLLINDWENNIPVIQLADKPNPLQKWMDIL